MSNAAVVHQIFSLMDERDYPSPRELLHPEFSAFMGGNPPMGFGEWEGMSQMIYAGAPTESTRSTRPSRSAIAWPTAAACPARTQATSWASRRQARRSPSPS